jgi:hypothetical protein
VIVADVASLLGAGSRLPSGRHSLMHGITGHYPIVLPAGRCSEKQTSS